MAVSEMPAGRDLEADALLWIARLPLLRASGLGTLTGAPDEAVRPALDALRRHGWIERLVLRLLGREGDVVVYALRPVAVPAFAAAFGLDEDEVRRGWPVGRRDLLDRITAFETTDAVNRSLASLAVELLDEDGSVLDMRALPRRRAQDRWWPGLVEAYGRVGVVGGRERPFFLAWDHPDIPVSHRRARLRARYAAREGSADGWPVTLLVCPSRIQERQWTAAARRAAWDQLDGPLAIAATTVGEVVKQPVDGCWRPLGEDYADGLFQVLEEPGSRHMFTLPRTRRYDLLDRGVSRRTTPLRDWAARLLASRRERGRDRVAALLLTLEGAHRVVLRHLARHPYLTEYEVALTQAAEDREARRLLGDLTRHGLVASLAREPADESRKRAATLHYFVTHEGLRLLAASVGVPPLRYAEHSHLAVETSAKGRGGNRLRNLRRNLDHTLGVNAVFARLARDAARAGDRLPFWWSESEATQHFEHDGRKYWVRPDGAGIYYVEGERKYFLLEYDRGTMRRRDYRRKLVGISAYFRSGEARRTYGERLKVLVVSETDAGERRFAEVAAESEGRWGNALPLLLTTRERLRREPRGMLGPIWRTPEQSGPRILDRARRSDGVKPQREELPRLVYILAAMLREALEDGPLVVPLR